MKNHNIQQLSDFTKQELINIEFVNSCYCGMNEIKRYNKTQLIDLIMYAGYCFDDEEEMTWDADEVRIIDHILKLELHIK